MKEARSKLRTSRSDVLPINRSWLADYATRLRKGVSKLGTWFSAQRQYSMNRHSVLKSPSSRIVQAVPNRYVARLKELHSILRTSMEPGYGLLLDLKKRNILTDQQFTEIHAEQTMFKQNDRLLELMSEEQWNEEQYEKFFASLTESGQHHLVNYIKATEGLDPFDDDRPLTSTEYDYVTRQSEFIMRHLVLNQDILDRMLATGCITRSHKEALELAGRFGYHRIAEFLTIIKRRSFAQFNQFLRCLRDADQGFIANVLESDRDVLSVDEETLAEERHRRIIEEFKQIRSNEERRRVIEQLLSIPEVDEGKSKQNKQIRLRFFCTTLAALKTLRNITYSGQLKSDIMSLCNSSLIGTGSDLVSVGRLCLMDYYHCEQHFVGKVFVDDVKEGCPWSLYSIDRPPIEIGEQLLLKSFILMYRSVPKTILRSQQAVFEALSSICSSWQKMLSKKTWLAKTLHGELIARASDVRVKRMARLSTNGRCIKGVAQLRDKIYVVYDHSNIISTFDSRSYLPQEDLKMEVGEIKNMDFCDIVSCNSTYSLYVYDKENRCVWRISEQSLWQFDLWLNRSCLSLSVTWLGCILLVDDSSPKFHIYGPDASLLHEVLIPGELVGPWQVVATKTDSFIISHQVNSLKFNYTISEVDTAGCIVRSYGTCPDDEFNQINCPIHLSVDNACNIYATDDHNQRLLILDSSLHVRTVLGLREEENETAGVSSRLCCSFDSNSHQLLVGLSSGYVNVYRLRSFA